MVTTLKLKIIGLELFILSIFIIFDGALKYNDLQIVLSAIPGGLGACLLSVEDVK